jgi:hypothetical protein
MTIPEHEPARPLRTALRLNALFSTATGLAAIVAGHAIAASLGADGDWHHWAVRAVGVGLACFALALLLVAAAPPRGLARGGLVVSALDGSWVVGSVAVLALFDLPRSGSILVGGTALVVAVFALAQALASARLDRDGDVGPLEVMALERPVAAPASAVWPVITDHAEYGRLAPNLSRVEVTSGPGEPLARRCTSLAGHDWNEACTLWDEGRRFAVDVDPRDYPYALAVIRGEWGVEPAASGPGSTIRMRFAFQARPGVRGALLAALMRPAFVLYIGPSIFRGWQRALAGRVSRDPAEASSSA